MQILKRSFLNSFKLCKIWVNLVAMEIEYCHTRKKIALVYTIASVFIFSFLSSCCGLGGERLPVNHPSFNIPNLLTIVNPKDTFHLNDTIWVRFQVPDSFTQASIGTCNMTDSILKINFGCCLRYGGTSIDSPIHMNRLIFVAKGTYISYEYWNLNRIGTSYVGDIGIILDNTAISSVCAYSSLNLSFPTSILAQVNECHYVKASSCSNYFSGFSIISTFQNDQSSYPLTVR